MNVGPFVLPSLAGLIVCVLVFIAIRWVYGDRDEKPTKPGAKSAERLQRARSRR